MYPDLTINEERRRYYHSQGWWTEKTLADYFAASVARHPHKDAVVDNLGGRLSYARLDAASGRVAAWLRAVHVAPGDVVSVQLPGWVEFTVCALGCFKAGAVLNPVLPNYRAAELGYILNKCESSVLIIPEVFRKCDYLGLVQDLTAFAPSLRQVVVVPKAGLASSDTVSTALVSNDLAPEVSAPGACTARRLPAGPGPQFSFLSEVLACTAPEPGHSRQGDDLAVVLFTSGTESRPKGVMLTHNTIYASIHSFAQVLGLGEHDSILMPAPTAHATGFHHGVVTPFILGGTSVLLDQFSPDLALELIEREKCTYTMGVASIIHDMFCQMGHQAYDLRALRFFLCGGSPSPWHIFEGALASGFKVISVYGSTESVPHSVAEPDAPVERLLGTDGRAVPHVEVRVVDQERRPLPCGEEGEEASRGPNVFVGYFNEAELTASVLDAEGWYYSGDLCRMDAEGYLRITGRKKDIIIRGGENISSTEVESILVRHALIRDASVVAMPDPRLGERSCAYVELYNDSKALTLDDLRELFEKHKVAKYKYPERIEIIDSLPRNPAGKIDKCSLRRQIREKLALEAKNAQNAPPLSACLQAQESALWHTRAE